MRLGVEIGEPALFAADLALMPDLEAHREGSIGHDARAQNYPDRPITWIVPFTPGGITDNSARVVAKAVGNVLGQPVIIDNRPGAGGSVGVEAATKAKPDGYTLLFATAPTITVNPVLYKNLSFDTRKDLVAIHGVGGASPILIVNPNRPYQTLPALIDYAKKNPEKINYASPGSGTVSHLAGALFQQLTGTKFTHVPIRGLARL